MAEIEFLPSLFNAGIGRSDFSAVFTAGRFPPEEVTEEHDVGIDPARASNPQRAEPPVIAELDTIDGKFAEPVSNDRKRMLSVETSSLASFQKLPVLTR